MGVMRDVEIVWDELLDAFENTDAELVFFLDRETGEVFFVPVDFEDESFWHEVERDAERYLRVPGFDYEVERQLVHEFIKGIANEHLKKLLENTFTGRTLYGRIEEILSFYPEEYDRLLSLKEELITDRMRNWLGEHDIYPETEIF